jgi:hypothetical protein
LWYSTVIYLTLGHKAQSVLDHPNVRILVRLPIRLNNLPVTKASKQATVRKSVPANGQEWLTSKNTATVKKAPTTKKKAVATKAKKVSKKAVTGKLKSKRKPAKKQSAAAAKDDSSTGDKVIELSSDESEIHPSDDEIEFDG